MQSKRKRILTMLENGTITTDEALTLLEKLNGEQTTGQGTTETSQSHNSEGTDHKAKPLRKPRRNEERVLNRKKKQSGSTQENNQSDESSQRQSGINQSGKSSNPNNQWMIS